MISESFSEGNTFIHRLDPRIKIISAFLFSVLVSVSDRLVSLLPALFIAIIMASLARLPLKKVCLRLLIINLLLFMLWLFIPFSLSGRTFLELGPLKASLEGVYYCLLLTIKSNSIIVILMALTGTMPLFKMGHAMSALYVPDKIVFLFIFTYRYIHAIHREYRRLKDAIDIRGFRPGTNIHTYRTYAYLIGMLLIKSHDRAERVQAAMLCRGFHGKFYNLGEFSIRHTDVLTFIFMFAALTVIALLQWTTIIY